MPAGLKAWVNKPFPIGVEMLAESKGFEKGVRFCRTACRPQKKPRNRRVEGAGRSLRARSRVLAEAGVVGRSGTREASLTSLSELA